MVLSVPADRLIAGTLLFIRVLAILATAPLLGARSVPARVKVGLAMVLTLILLPQALVGAGFQPVSSMPGFALAVAGEVLVGAALGLLARLLFAGVELSGQVMGFQMGFGIVNVIDPQTQTQVSILGQFQGLVALLVFLSVNAHHVILAALVRSLEVMPLAAPRVGVEASGGLVRWAGEMFAIGAKLAAPVVITLFIANVVLGIIARTVPQINLLIVGFPLTIALGLAVLGLSLPFMGRAVQTLFQGLEGRMVTLLDLMH